MSAEHPDLLVSFGVKELLGGIDGKLAAIESKLDKKANMSDVEQLTRRIDTADQRISDIRADLRARVEAETKTATNRALTLTRREKVAGLVIAAVAVLVQIPAIRHF